MKFSILLVGVYTLVRPWAVVVTGGRFDELNQLVKRWRPDECPDVQIVEYQNGPRVDLVELLSRDDRDDIVTEHNYTVKVPRLHRYLSVMYVFDLEEILAMLYPFLMFCYEYNMFDRTFLPVIEACNRTFYRMYDTLRFFDKFVNRGVTLACDRLTSDIQKVLIRMLNMADLVHQIETCFEDQLLIVHGTVLSFYRNNVVPVPYYVSDESYTSHGQDFVDDVVESSTKSFDEQIQTIQDKFTEYLKRIESMYTNLGYLFDHFDNLTIAPLPQLNTFSPPPQSEDGDDDDDGHDGER